MMQSDMELLREYAQSKSERAFKTLVHRHVNLVYSVAHRQIRDPHLAEEVVQTVFTILARKAGSISSRVIIAGWLCRTARFVAAKATAMQQRRARHELQASMEPHSESDPNSWAIIEPALETAMSELGEKDHDALTLRFFEDRSFKEIASAIGTTEPAAKMRVNRALEKLRQIFAHRGITASAAGIASTVSANGVHAAPAHLAATVSSTILKTGAASIPATALTKSIFKIMAWTKLKTSIAVGAVVLAVGGGATAILHEHKTAAPQVTYAFAGYATPEAAVQSLIWGASTGDAAKYLDALTPLESERFKNRVFAGKTDEQIRQKSIAFAKAMQGYKITRKQVISDDEVRIEVSAPPSPDALRDGTGAIIMKKIGNDWKNAGDAP
jgi:RNA polymerase sigma factor (sigma-70 family)